jgi:hypothetical protein
VISAWERFLAHGTQLEYFKYSGYFDLYPYLPSSDFTLLIVQSPSVHGVDETHEFQGQVSPELATGTAGPRFYDEMLFQALMRRWSQRHLMGRPPVARDESLFRSLEMAYRASRIPQDNRSSLEDYGAQISLWVSAFEILAWPSRQYAGVEEVLALLRPGVAASGRLRRRRYLAPLPRGRRRRVTLAEKLYCEMYQTRNNFLHGNPGHA